MEVDLAAPVKKIMWTQDHWHKVEFDSLYLICSLCHRYSHVSKECSFEVSIDEGVKEKKVSGATSSPVEQPRLRSLESDQNSNLNSRVKSRTGEAKNLEGDSDGDSVTVSHKKIVNKIVY